MPPYKDYNLPPYNALQHYMLRTYWKFKYHEFHKKRLGRL